MRVSTALMSNTCVAAYNMWLDKMCAQDGGVPIDYELAQIFKNQESNSAIVVCTRLQFRL